jgi:hypothetical protein
MPGSVMAAIAALGLMLALELGMHLLVLVIGNLQPAQLGQLLGRLAFSVIVGGLILWGLIAGHRLAWQWGRVLGLLGALLMLLVGIFGVHGRAGSGGHVGSSRHGRGYVVHLRLPVHDCLLLGHSIGEKVFPAPLPGMRPIHQFRRRLLFQRSQMQEMWRDLVASVRRKNAFFAQLPWVWQ